MKNQTYFEKTHKSSYGKPLVMIVEDETSIRLLASKFFQFNDCITNDFVNGMDAHEILAINYGAKKKSLYSLILSDITMPHMDGIDLAERAAILAPETPFILMTGNPQDSYPPNVREVIYKPFSFPSTIKRLLNQYVNHSVQEADNLAR